MAETKSKLGKDINQQNIKAQSLDLHHLKALVDAPIAEEDKALLQQYAKDFHNFRLQFRVSDKRLAELLDTKIEILIALEYGFGELAVVKDLMKKVKALEFAWNNLCD